jgi:hypothetical protein
MILQTLLQIGCILGVVTIIGLLIQGNILKKEFNRIKNQK